jgi:hypothetical protein
LLATRVTFHGFTANDDQTDPEWAAPFLPRTLMPSQ